MLRVSRTLKKCKLYPVVFLLAVATIGLQVYKLDYTTTHTTVERKISKRITWLYSFHGGLRNHARLVDMSQCEYSDCSIDFIDNEDDKLDKFNKADAVLFQGGRFPIKPPKRAHNDQVYVFVDIEAPLHLHKGRNYAKKEWFHGINWTMTYRRDSDIRNMYGSFHMKPSTWEDKRNYSEIFHRKTKDALWMVSDCKTEGLREEYVKLLQKYIDVDIYGLCGRTPECYKENGKDCLKEISQPYKFYLSFENSLCMDYVTEKVYNWFDFDVINIVRGAGNYVNILPHNTYVNTANFKTVGELAKYLKILGSNEEVYTKMLKLKAKYKVEEGISQSQRAYCKLCERLHNLGKYRNTYNHIADWWEKDKCTEDIKDIK